MTFNIRGSQRPDGANAWRHRAPLNVRTIRRYSPDLIGFQEFQNGNLRTYKRELSAYEHTLGPEYENHRPYAHNAIFWNPSRLELLDSGGFWLSETPEKRSRSWQTNQVRSANWARFRLVENGVEFLHLNTHLDHRSGEARMQGSKLITGKLAEMGNEPVVLTGDFNCNPGSKSYQIYARAGFSDAHLACGNPPSNTFHRFRGTDFRPKVSGREARLDWVLFRDGAKARWEARSCRVVRDAEQPLYPSDHYPVVAELFLSRS